MRTSIAPFAALISATAILSGTSVGQSIVTVPAGLDQREGNSRGLVPGFNAHWRQQVLLDASLLSTIAGQPVQALWLRRDHELGIAYPAGRARVRLSISTAQRGVANPSRNFADNRGTPTVVFDGELALPAVTAPTGAAPWATPSAVRVPFSTPFVHGSGDLCIEIEGTPVVTPAAWSVDYEHRAVGATVSPRGTPCGGPSNHFRNTALAWGRHLVPGSTGILVSFGQPSTPAIVVLGAAPIDPGVPLDGIGATGCKVYVRPDIAVPTAYGALTGPTPFAPLRFELELPASTTLLGKTFHAQWVNLETGPARSNPAGLTTTNALDITMAATPPPVMMSTVSSRQVDPSLPWPDEGRIQVARGPVLGFELQSTR